MPIRFETKAKAFLPPRCSSRRIRSRAIGAGSAALASAALLIGAPVAAGWNARVKDLGPASGRAIADGVRYVGWKVDDATLRVLDTKKAKVVKVAIDPRCDLVGAGSGRFLLACSQRGDATTPGSLYRVYSAITGRLVDVPFSSPPGLREDFLALIGKYWLAGDSCTVDPHGLDCERLVVNWRTGEQIIGGMAALPPAVGVPPNSGGYKLIDLDVSAPTPYRVAEHDTIVVTGRTLQKVYFRPRGSDVRKILLTRRSYDLSAITVGGGYVTWLEAADGGDSYVYRYTIESGRRVRWRINSAPTSLTVRHASAAVYVSIRQDDAPPRWQILRATR